MKSFSLLSTLLLAGSALAAPISNANGSQAVGSKITDLDVLQFALTLEYLEITLYEEGVNAFSNEQFTAAGYSADTRPRFEEVIQQEVRHISTLQAAVRKLGATPTQPCQYQFNYTDVTSFLNLTDIVNGVGPSAYLGAGAFIQDKVLLVQGSSIGQNEAQHHSALNIAIGRDPFPTTFQLSLSFSQVYGIASPFLLSCPKENPELKAVTAYPAKLTVTNPGAPGLPLAPGGTINLQPGANFTAPSGGARVAFLYAFNTTIVSYNNGAATLPVDIAGNAYAVLTTAYDGQALSDDNSLTAPAPFFVDILASTFANTNVANRTYTVQQAAGQN